MGKKTYTLNCMDCNINIELPERVGEFIATHNIKLRFEKAIITTKTCPECGTELDKTAYKYSHELNIVNERGRGYNK